MFKARPLLDKVLGKFQQLNTPESAAVLDEHIVPSKGRLNVKQNAAGKSNTYACNLYKISSPNSYNRNIQVYVGKRDQFFSFGYADSKPLDFQKILLAVLELTMLTTFTRQCHSLSNI